MENKYIKKGKLKDKDIVVALRRCADDYENGELIEVLDELVEIYNAIKEFEENYNI